LRKSKIAVNLLITILLVGSIAVISFNAFQSSSKNDASKLVYGLTLVPVPGADVSASGDNGSGATIADNQGMYDITTYLATGSYSVTASANGFIDQALDDVNVTGGLETTGQNIVMNVSAGISGKVTDAATGLPISDAIVTVYGDQATFTDVNGNYQITQNLEPGTYNVTAEAFLGGYLDATDTAITLTAGSITANVNFALAKSGAIIGTVTDANTHAALKGILVEGESSDGVYSAVADTNSSGQYTLNTNLPTGTYNLTEFFPTGYLTTTVQGIAVTTGQTTTENIALNPSGVISGTVTNVANGAPLSGADIIVTDLSDNFVGDATTDSSGNYQVNTNLVTGSYVVEAFYGESLLTYPSNVAVVAGTATTGINFQFAVTASGTITGRVTSSTGGPIADASVSAEGAGGFGSNSTDINGNYIISTGLGTGTYTVSVSVTGYGSQQQAGVAVTINTVTSGINFVLTPLPTGSISGQVLAAQANPFPTPTPSPTPTPAPTATPTPAPTASPTPAPTASPTPAPTASPTPGPTASPTPAPTAAPTPVATPTPTPAPTQSQTQDTIVIYNAVGGTTDPLEGTTTAADGSSFTITATAGAGFVFDSWSVATASGGVTYTDNPLTLTLNGSLGIQPVFDPVVFVSPATTSETPAQLATNAIVVLVASTGGTTSPAPGYYSMTDATNLNITAIPASGWTFDHWVIGGTPLTHGAYSFTDTPTNNPYNVNHGYGNTYYYQPIFKPISTSTTPTPKVNEFSSATAVIMALILLIAASGTYAYTRRAKK
jgi:hypothetical protein